MTIDELKQHIDKFFSDTSRPAYDTKADLLEVAEYIETLAASIPDENDD